MYNFHKIEVIKKPIHIVSDENEYAFPVSGFQLNNHEIEIGFAKFISLEKFKEMNSDLNFSDFENESIIIIKTENLKGNFKNDGLNSLALKYAKEVIGYLYFSFYFNVNKEVDKKILISNKLDSNLDEGLVPYFEYKDKYYKKSYGKADFSTNFYEMKKCIEYNKKPFEIPVTNRNELQNKIFKCFEFLYYINNEIYAVERMTKYFLLLNHLFRIADNVDLNRKGLTRYLNYLLDENSKEIFQGKFTSEFEILYEKMRNNILHGILDSYRETTLVDVSFFYPIRNLFMEILNILYINDKYNKFSNSKELIDFIDTELRKR